MQRLGEEIVAMTGENKTVAVKKSSKERRGRAICRLEPSKQEAELIEFLEREVWCHVPKELLGKGVPPEEQDAALGYDRSGLCK